MTTWFQQIAVKSPAAPFVGATLAAWLALVIFFGGFSYIDAARAGIDAALTRSLLLYALGFAPWLGLGPAIYVLACRQVRKHQTWAVSLAETGIILAAAFGAIFLYFLFIYAPLMGMTAAEAVSRARLLQWTPDVFIFIIVFLAGRRSAAGPQFTDPNARIAVRSQGRVDYLHVRDITSGSAQGNYVALRTESGEQLYRGLISDLAEQLAPYGIVRAHRSHFIRPENVVSASMQGGAVCAVQLEIGLEIPVSAQFESAVRQSLSAAVIHTG